MVPLLQSGSEILICENIKSKVNSWREQRHRIFWLTVWCWAAKSDFNYWSKYRWREFNGYQRQTRVSVTNAKGQWDDICLFFAAQKSFFFMFFKNCSNDNRIQSGLCVWEHEMKRCSASPLLKKRFVKQRTSGLKFSVKGGNVISAAALRLVWGWIKVLWDGNICLNHENLSQYRFRLRCFFMIGRERTGRS